MHKLIFLFVMQISQMNTLQPRTVVHLHPNKFTIDVSYGGKLLELINAPSKIYLPPSPPKPDMTGVPWTLDIKNLGGGTVSVGGSGTFRVQVSVGQTVHIFSNGTVYSLTH